MSDTHVTPSTARSADTVNLGASRAIDPRLSPK